MPFGMGPAGWTYLNPYWYPWGWWSPWHALSQWSWPTWPYTAPFWGGWPGGAYAPSAATAEAELSALKSQAQWLESELNAINQRIEELEKKE